MLTSSSPCTPIAPLSPEEVKDNTVTSLKRSWQLEGLCCVHYVGHGFKGHGDFRGTENITFCLPRYGAPGSAKFSREQALKLYFAHIRSRRQMLLELYLIIAAFHACLTALVKAYVPWVLPVW